MQVTHTVRGLAVISLLLVPWIGVAPAQASCALPAPLPSAIHSASGVFVGTVTATTWQGRRATVSVEDVWRGQVTSPAVVVGSPGDARTYSSVDRKYVVGTTYLFVSYASRAGEWQDNNCSNTRAYTPALARYRPAGAARIAVEPTSSPVPTAEPPRPQKSQESGRWWWALAGVGIAGVPVVVLLRRRRTKRIGAE